MSRILINVLPASGHLNPILAIGQALQQRGHDVAVATATSYHPQLERAGLTPLTLRYPAGAVPIIMQQFQKPARWTSQFQVKPPQMYFFDYLDSLVAQLINIIRGFKPDVLLSDLNSYAGPIAADACQLPYATYCAIVNTYRSDDSPPYGLGSDWYPQNHPMRLLWPALNLPVEFVLWRHDRIINPIRRRYGLPTVRGGMLQHSPYLSMVPTTDAYEYPRQFVSPQIMYVGPVTSPQRGEIHDDFPWSWLDDERPTLYVSMGTIVGAIRVFHNILDVALGAPWKAIFAIGRGTDKEQFAHAPNNVLIRNFVPQLELLPHVDAVISHGGNNTVSETLLHGIPLLVIPMSADQPESAGRVKASGAGRRLRPGLAEGQRLRKAIDAILFDQRYRQGAEAIMRSYQQTNGAQTAALLVEQLIDAKRPIHRIDGDPTVLLNDVSKRIRPA